MNRLKNGNEGFWNEISAIEEDDFDDEKINRVLRWREIKRNLDGVETILDVGAATGAFSISLASMGYEVTHFDISYKMIKKAKEKSKDLTNIKFVKGDAADLSRFKENEFDLVLNFDGSISFSGRNANKVISESCRVGKKVILTVSNKACMTATWLNYSLSKLNRIHPSVEKMMKTGYWNRNEYRDGLDITSIEELKAYDVEELKEVLENNDMIVSECRGLGSLTHLYLIHLYRQYNTEDIVSKIDHISINDEFIEMCDYYDRYLMNNGMGSFRRAGIIAVANKLY